MPTKTTIEYNRWSTDRSQHPEFAGRICGTNLRDIYCFISFSCEKDIRIKGNLDRRLAEGSTSVDPQFAVPSATERK
ncbi:hypothetical protein D3OALGB2SA_805 [Olavius algarvensis associated proteobacterium Delta 3]|nr:hypothetical protein D3OALGB2SA_805 [Olavius algarvensis associated proteobacterium Delta 3]